MSVVRSVDATLKNFECKINGVPVLLDHIKQLNLYIDMGQVSEEGDITITYDMFKMLDERAQEFSPINKRIVFDIEDNKTGTGAHAKHYEGIIYEYNKHIHNVKQDCVILKFDREKFLRLKTSRWWKCFQECTILEIFKEFLAQFEIPLNVYPTNHTKLRGTFWENFAIPQNMPTLDFLLGELKKDNLMVFHNPETQGVTVASCWDLQQLDVLCQNFPDFVVDGILAKFDESKNQWKEITFVNAKQIDTRAPWKIMEWTSTAVPNLFMEMNHTNFWYSGLKKELEHTIRDAEIKPNELVVKEAEHYSGLDLSQVQIKPYPTVPALRDNTKTPRIDTTGFQGTSNAAIYPRYMFYRMRESYVNRIKWIQSSMTIAGSCKAVVPLTALMVTYYENAMNADKTQYANGDIWQSGLYVITGTKLSIIGNNILSTYTMQKPYP